MKLTHDAHCWYRKWSTWLGIMATASGAVLTTFNTWPARLQELTPDWALSVLGVTVFAGLLVPAATSIAQRSIPKPGEGE